MPISSSTRGTIFGALSFILTASLSACTPEHQKNTSANHTHLSLLAEQSADCEQSIRKKMEEKSLFLAPNGELSKEISQANELVRDTPATEYEVTLNNSQVVELSAEFSKQTESDLNSISYSLSPSDRMTKSLLDFKIKIKHLHVNDSEVILGQSFQVRAGCTFTFSQTVKEYFKRNDKNNITYTKTTIYSDGQIQNASTSFSIPENAFFNDLQLDITKLEDLPNEAYSYGRNIGIFRVLIGDGPKILIKEFGAAISLATKVADWSLNGKSVAKVQIGLDSAGQYRLISQSLDQRAWKVPSAIWKKQSLSTSGDLNDLVKLNLPEEYLQTHNSIKLVTTAPIIYDHLDAYWKSKKLSGPKSHNEETLLLTENGFGTISDKATPADLASNETIQTNLPEIQSAAQNILSFTKDRNEQIVAILNYLKNHYAFDEAMMENNIIRPLTTKEALDRKKGVCQHYSVIYTALARALNIPTRIVHGYYIGGAKAVGHAWVESEIDPQSNTWKLIEPQNPAGLYKTKPRKYLPIARAKYLEDKNIGYSGLIPLVFNVKYLIEPGS